MSTSFQDGLTPMQVLQQIYFVVYLSEFLGPGRTLLMFRLNIVIYTSTGYESANENIALVSFDLLIGPEHAILKGVTKSLIYKRICYESATLEEYVATALELLQNSA